MATDPLSPALAELAEECGVATGYVDARGDHHDVSARTIRAVLAAMGVRTNENGTSDSDEAALARVRDSRWARIVPPTLAVRQGGECSVPVHVPHEATVRVWVELEDGTLSPDLGATGTPVLTREIRGERIDRLDFPIPRTLPPGWHRLVATIDHGDPGPPAQACSAAAASSGGPSGNAPGSHRYEEESATLMVSPMTIPFPAGLDERPATGLAAQLYQIRSAESWGVGDLADLRGLLGWAGRDLGADFVLVNPMHAGEPLPPVEPSPYLPTSRRFASALYVRPEEIPEFPDQPDAVRARVRALAAEAITGNSADTIDRDTSWRIKLEALRLIFASGMSRARRDEFEAFTTDRGEELHLFATWCALVGVHGPRWSEWPEGLRAPGSAQVAEFAAEHDAEICFHEWLQWVVAEQRAAAQDAARSAGMRLGILHDLAVGVHPEGADAWALHHALARGVSVGAPPDIYNQQGQDWSQPPLRPDALAEQGYRPLRDIVRAALRDAGGVRIDHILGMFRLWWIPAGLEPTQGTYVRYNHEAMLGVLALEAWRAGAVVVGEDLGTVAPGVREELADRGILGTSVLWFEQDDSGAPLPPEGYRRSCMASVTTHDLPPTAGYVDLVHVDIRARLGQLTGDPHEERRGAAEEIARFVDVLRERGMPAGASPMDVSVGLHALLGAAPSRLLAVSVADLVGDRRPVNIPGTSDEYPNWRVPLSGPDGEIVALEDLRSSALARRVMDTVSARGEVASSTRRHRA